MFFSFHSDKKMCTGGGFTYYHRNPQFDDDDKNPARWDVHLMTTGAKTKGKERGPIKNNNYNFITTRKLRQDKLISIDSFIVNLV